MIEIGFYGRGGQGAVTAAQLLAQAAFLEGYYAQAFPKFGIERRGAPVTAYARIDHAPIQIRSNIQEFDFAVVGDMMAVLPDPLFQKIKGTGSVIFNTTRSPEELKFYAQRIGKNDIRIFVIDATGISLRVYGETSIPITSVTMIGAFCSVSKLIQLNSIKAALEHFFPSSLVTKNVEAAHLGFKEVKGS
jgi:2-oxoacid:acceptor oxidoreductase gamma subunit (pyruvate/2-ketoisovalerate family)